MNSQGKNEAGFTLVETAIALVVMMVASLAVSSLFVYSIQNNLGGAERALAMAVAQQQLEQLRSVSFDDATLAIGTTTLPTVTQSQRNYGVVRTIANVTNSDGSLKRLKRITITVTPQNAGEPWQSTPVVLTSLRSTLSPGPYVAQ
ncbi:MAG: prepilin-type N-terminal cleavage/methylation domain-containing protein [Pyrinomonadaceae bacterium]